VNLNLNLPAILVMLVGSGVGCVYLSWARTESDVPLAASGLALMIYSYFISSLVWLIVVGAALAVAPFAYRRFA
jgi:hypothetical protein